jgi:hypothetical protein
MMKFSARNLPPLIPAISPDIQGERAYDLLSNEQKATLIYALNDMAEGRGLTVRPMSAWIRGHGELRWAFEKRTILNKKPALKIWPVPAPVEVGIVGKMLKLLK